MKGYKGTDKDMRCRGVQFEVGKTYTVDGKIELCTNGIHFCEKLRNVYDYYPNSDGNRYFEVEANESDCIIGGDKIVTSKITFLRELTQIEVNRNFYGDGYGYGYGYGNGDGYGNGYGNGNGYGDGYGNGYGDGNGYGYGNGYGNGNGYGDGYGNGNGYGDGDGYGNGYGVNSYKILKFM